jgi:hypothetical protein
LSFPSEKWRGFRDSRINGLNASTETPLADRRPRTGQDSRMSRTWSVVLRKARHQITGFQSAELHTDEGLAKKADG